MIRIADHARPPMRTGSTLTLKVWEVVVVTPLLVTGIASESCSSWGASKTPRAAAKLAHESLHVHPPRAAAAACEKQA